MAELFTFYDSASSSNASIPPPAESTHQISGDTLEEIKTTVNERSGDVPQSPSSSGSSESSDSFGSYMAGRHAAYPTTANLSLNPANPVAYDPANPSAAYGHDELTRRVAIARENKITQRLLFNPPTHSVGPSLFGRNQKIEWNGNVFYDPARDNPTKSVRARLEEEPTSTEQPDAASPSTNKSLELLSRNIDAAPRSRTAFNYPRHSPAASSDYSSRLEIDRRSTDTAQIGNEQLEHQSVPSHSDRPIASSRIKPRYPSLGPFAAYDSENIKSYADAYNWSTIAAASVTKPPTDQPPLRDREIATIPLAAPVAASDHPTSAFTYTETPTARFDTDADGPDAAFPRPLTPYSEDSSIATTSLLDLSKAKLRARILHLSVDTELANEQGTYIPEPPKPGSGSFAGTSSFPKSATTASPGSSLSVLGRSKGPASPRQVPSRTIRFGSCPTRDDRSASSPASSSPAPSAGLGIPDIVSLNQRVPRPNCPCPACAALRKRAEEVARPLQSEPSRDRSPFPDPAVAQKYAHGHEPGCSCAACSESRRQNGANVAAEGDSIIRSQIRTALARGATFSVLVPPAAAPEALSGPFVSLPRNPRDRAARPIVGMDTSQMPPPMLPPLAERLPVPPGDFLGMRERLRRVGIDLKYSGNGKVREEMLGEVDGKEGGVGGRAWEKLRKGHKKGLLSCFK